MSGSQNEIGDGISLNLKNSGTAQYKIRNNEHEIECELSLLDQNPVSENGVEKKRDETREKKVGESSSSKTNAPQLLENKINPHSESQSGPRKNIRPSTAQKNGSSSLVKSSSTLQRSKSARTSTRTTSLVQSSETEVSKSRKNSLSSKDSLARLLTPTTSSSAKKSTPRSQSVSQVPNTAEKNKLTQRRPYSSFKSQNLNSSNFNRSPSARLTNTEKEMGDSVPVESGAEKSGGDAPAGLKDQFTAFSKFGDSTSDGKQITLSNCDKWMKQAQVIDGKKITTTDTSITFKKLFKIAKKVSFSDFKRYVEDLATSKKLEVSEIYTKLLNCGPPGVSSATKAAGAGVVARLTDTSKYTGSHKERFDADGKGKGISGRRDIKDDSGYVAAFKEKQEGSSPTPPPVTNKK